MKPHLDSTVSRALLRLLELSGLALFFWCISLGAPQVGSAAIDWGAVATFNSGSTGFGSIAALSDTKFVVVYQDAGDGYGKAVVGDLSARQITYGAAAPFHEAATIYWLDVIPLSSTKFVVVYLKNADNHGWARVGTVSGSSITYGSEVEFNAGQTGWPSVAALSESQVVVAYEYSNGFSIQRGKAKVGTVTGNSLTFGEETDIYNQNVFNPGEAFGIGVAALSSTRFVLTYQNASDGQDWARVGDVSGTSITYGSPTSFDGGANPIGVTALSATKFVVAYQFLDESSSSYRGAAGVGTVSGTNITFGSRAYFASGTSAVQVLLHGAKAIAALSESRVVVGYARFDGDNGTSYGYAVEGDVSGSDIAFGSGQGVNAGSQAWEPAVAKLSANGFVAGWSNYTDYSGMARVSLTLKAEPSSYPTGLQAATNSGTQITTSWTDSTGTVLPDGYLLLCNKTGTFTAPVNGVPQTDDTSCADGSGVKNIAQGIQTYAWTGLDSGVTYYFTVFPYTNSGSDIVFKTAGTPPAANAATSGPGCTANSTGNWSTSGIWSCGRVPQEGDNVVISPGVTVTLDVDPTPILGNVTLSGTLTVPGSQTIRVGGAFSNSGTFNPGTGTVQLVGSAAQTLTGNPFTFYNLVLVKTSKTDTVTVVGKLQVTKKLTITKGKLKTAGDYGDVEIGADGELELTNDSSIGGNFTLNAGGILTPGTATMTFNGAGTQTVTGNVTFYNLVIASGTTVDAGNYTVTVNGTFTNNGTLLNTTTEQNAQKDIRVDFGDGRGLPSLALTSTGATNLGLTHVTFGAHETPSRCDNQSFTGSMVRRTFAINPTQSTGVTATVRLYFAPTELNGLTAGALRMYHCGATGWQELSGTYAYGTDGTSGYYYVELSGVTAFSPFALGPANAPTAAQLSTFHAKFNVSKAQVRLQWTTVNELNVVGFNVWRRAGTGDWKMLNATPIAAKQTGMLFGDTYARNDKTVKAGKVYHYKLEIVLADGHSEWSDVKRAMSK